MKKFMVMVAMVMMVMTMPVKAEMVTPVTTDEPAKVLYEETEQKDYFADNVWYMNDLLEDQDKEDVISYESQIDFDKRSAVYSVNGRNGDYLRVTMLGGYVSVDAIEDGAKTHMILTDEEFYNEVAF